MKTQISKIIHDVMVAIHEVNPNEAQFVGDRDNADLETIIERMIEPTIDQLHEKADLSQMAGDAAVVLRYDGNKDDPRIRFKTSTGVLSFLLCSHSDDFDQTFNVDVLRMTKAHAKGWPFEVVNVVYPDDPLFAIVTDRYVGAQPDFPAVTRRKRQVFAQGRKVVVDTLELRSLYHADDTATVYVIPKAKIDNGMVDIDSHLYHALVDAIAQQMTVEQTK